MELIEYIQKEISRQLEELRFEVNDKLSSKADIKIEEEIKPNG